jgi:hypothetical protein
MARKYPTGGRTIVNYRGRNSRLTLVPTAKAPSGWAVCDSHGTACRVLEADGDPDVLRIETEPAIPGNGPGATLYADVRLERRNGIGHFTEIKGAQLLNARALAKLERARQHVERTGQTYEVVDRDDVVHRVRAAGLIFLHRFRGIVTDDAQRAAVAEVVRGGSQMRLSRWLEAFSTAGMPASHLYWAISRRLLVIVSPSLFPDGELAPAGKVT